MGIVNETGDESPDSTTPRIINIKAGFNYTFEDHCVVILPASGVGIALGRGL